MQARLRFESELKTNAQEQLVIIAEQLAAKEAEAEETVKSLNETLAKAEEEIQSEERLRFEAERKIEEQAGELVRLHNHVAAITKSYEEALAQAKQKTENLVREKAEIEARVEKQIRSYIEQLAEIKVESAQVIARVKSELEIKAENYAESIVKIQAEAVKELAAQKEEYEAKAANEISRIKSEASSEVARLRTLLEEKAQEYEAFRKQVELKAEARRQARREREQELQDALRHIACLEQQLKLKTEFEYNVELELKEQKDALSRAYDQITSLTGQLSQAKVEAAESVAKAKSELEVKAGVYAESIMQARAQVAEAVAAEKQKWEAQTAGMINEIKAISLQELSALQVQFETQRQQYEATFEKTDSQLCEERGLRLQTEQQLKDLSEKLTRMEEQLKPRSEAQINVTPHTGSEAKLEAQQEVKSLTEQIARLRTETAEAVAEVKSQLEQKAIDYSEAVVKAQAKALEMLGEERSRWESETEQKIAEIKTEAEARIDEYRNSLEQARDKIESEIRLRLEAEQNLKFTSERLAGLRQKIKAAAERKAQREAQAQTRTGTCECCGKNDIEQGELVKIDSGQFFCRGCLNALKSSAAS